MYVCLFSISENGVLGGLDLCVFVVCVVLYICVLWWCRVDVLCLFLFCISRWACFLIYYSMLCVRFFFSSNLLYTRVASMLLSVCVFGLLYFTVFFLLYVRVFYVIFDRVLFSFFLFIVSFSVCFVSLCAVFPCHLL